MDKSEDKIQLRDSFRYLVRLLVLVKPYWGKLAKGLSLSLVLGLIGMVVPYLTKLLIDKVYPSQDVTLLGVIVLTVLGISMASTIIGTLQGYYNLVINAHLNNSTSLMFFNHLQHLKIRFYDDHRVGEVMSRFRDVGKSLGAVSNLFQVILVNGIYLFLVPPFLFLLNWKLAFVSLISLPLTVVIISASGKFVRKYWKRSAEAFAELNAFQVESLSNIQLIKSMVLETYVFRKCKDQIEKAVNIQLRAGAVGQTMGLFNSFIRIVNTALFTWLGWKYILTKEMTLGDYMAFTAYIGYLYNPLAQVVGLFSDFQRSSVSLSRMYEYLDSDVEQTPDFVYKDASPLTNKIHGDIELRNVGFSYDGGKTILSNVNLKIAQGTVIAILGPSGSGKTTLLRLLSGMETLREGTILFDGRPSSSFTLYELRKQVSVVWQEVGIVKGSIWDNLTMGLEIPDEVAVNRLMEICKMDELIKSLPNGLQTELSEWGSTLSSGQRQRIAIARAVLRNSPVLLLDEVTSSIDIATEVDLLKNLFEFLKGKTIIFVTHRMTCTHLSDKICFLEGGQIGSTGSHEELLVENPWYRQMYASASSN